MKIGFDLDGVLYDFHQALYSEVVAFYNVTCSFDEFWTKEVHTYSKLKQDNLVELEYLYTKCPPPKKWVETVNKLSEKHDIFYVTARSDSLKYVTYLSLEKFGYPKLDNLYFTHNKLEVCLKNNCDIFIEDRDKYIDQLKNDMEVIVVAKSWNTKYWNDHRVIQNITELENLL